METRVSNDPIEQLLAQCRAESERLYPIVAAHRAAYVAADAQARALSTELKRLEELREQRRQWIKSRLGMRATVRNFSRLVQTARGWRGAPAKAGGVRSLIATRAAELADQLRAHAVEVDTRGWGSGIYALFDGHELVYIGQSVNVNSRVAQHSGKHFTHAAYIAVPVEKLDEMERALLNLFTPRLNRDPETLKLRGEKQSNWATA